MSQAPALTVEDMNSLRHMLGMQSNVSKRDWGFRNYYCTHGDDAGMKRLEALGWIEPTRRPAFLHEKAQVWRATRDGCRAAGLTSRQIAKLFKGAGNSDGPWSPSASQPAGRETDAQKAKVNQG